MNVEELDFILGTIVKDFRNVLQAFRQCQSTSTLFPSALQAPFTKMITDLKNLSKTGMTSDEVDSFVELQLKLEAYATQLTKSTNLPKLRDQSKQIVQDFLDVLNLANKTISLQPNFHLLEELCAI